MKPFGSTDIHVLICADSGLVERMHGPPTPRRFQKGTREQESQEEERKEEVTLLQLQVFAN